MGYQIRVVAFIDILGFRKIVTSENNFDSILKVTQTIIKDKNDNDNWNKISKNSDFEETVFSDSIIMSTTLEYGGFYYLLNRVSFLLQVMVENGFIARGGITIGEMYHEKDVAFGPALIKAVELEEKLALFPRVIMDEDTYQQGLNADDKINNYKDRKELIDIMLKEYSNEINEKFYFVDYLVQRVDYDTDEGYETLLSKAKEIIEVSFKTITDKHILDKYKWYKMYLEQVLEENGLLYENI